MGEKKKRNSIPTSSLYGEIAQVEETSSKLDTQFEKVLCFTLNLLLQTVCFLSIIIANAINLNQPKPDPPFSSSHPTCLGW